jgi:hypothetical protein
VDERAQALTEIARLARAHGLSAEEIGAALGESARGAHASGSHARDVIVRVLGYLGGTFVFAGICIFVGLQWATLNSAARVIITLGSGVAAMTLAALSEGDHRFDRATTPLFLIGLVLQPTGMMVAFAEYGSGGDWRWASLLMCGTMAAQCAAIYRGIPRSTLIFFAILFGVCFWWTTLDLADVPDKWIAVTVGAGIVLASIGLDRGGHGDITAAWYLAGTLAFLGGLFAIVDRTAGELLFLAIAAAFVYLSTLLASRTMLSVATLAILAYTGVFTNRNFADSVGWPIALIFFGAFMIGLSALAVRLDRRFIRRG